MTDQQIRDRIVGALSASMMPMEVEAECVAFLDRCVKPVTTRADRIRAANDEEMAAELDEFLNDPFCRNFEECVKLVEQDKELPEGSCRKCILRYLQEVVNDGST